MDNWVTKYVDFFKFIHADRGTKLYGNFWHLIIQTDGIEILDSGTENPQFYWHR